MTGLASRAVQINAPFFGLVSRRLGQLDGLSLASGTAILLIVLPILVGLMGIVLPAFGWLPAIGARTLSLEPWQALAAQPGVMRAIAISLACGLCSAFIALTIVALFLAGFTGTRTFERMRRLVSPLLAVPHAAAAFGLVFLLSPSGWIVRLLSPWATGWTRPPDLLIVNDPMGLSLIAGLVIKEVPFLLLMSLAALPQLNTSNRLMLARTLGYGRVTAWFKVVAPALYPLIRLPVLAVIGYAVSVVDMAMILGPSNPPTLGIMVLRWQINPDLQMRLVAAAGALLLLAMTLLALGLWIAGERLVGLVRWRLTDGKRDHGDRQWAMIGAFGMGLSTAALLFALLGLAVWSLAGTWRFPSMVPTLSLANWTLHGPTMVLPLVTTIGLGLIATTVAMIVVVGALENEIRQNWQAGRAILLLYLPLIVPPVAFLFGLAMGFETIGIRPGFWPVVLGHIVFVLPYVYLSLAESYRQLDQRWALLARTLGASPLDVFLRVRLPMLVAPCLTAFAVGLSVSVGQYLATQLLGGGRVLTVTTEAVALASGGDRRVIGVWAFTQAILPAAGFVLAIGLPRMIWRHRRGMRG
jgi:putative thiamine transport system permease protein